MTEEHADEAVPDAGEGQTPVGWLDSVKVEGTDEPVRVIFVRRDGFDVIVRQCDPCDPEPPRIPMYAGDTPRVMTAISHTSLNTTAEIGDVTGLILALRLVPTRREPGRVFARTLRHGEVDDGRRVHVEPGESVTIEGLTVELDAIDSTEPVTKSGHVPLTPTMWTWRSIGERDETVTRYVLAAARRLDTANLLLIEVEERREALRTGPQIGPTLRRHTFELLGLVESAVVALSRALDMATRASDLIGATVPVPGLIVDATAKITAIRNAYEHIEDRALGQVRGQPDPIALSIFDFSTLLAENAIVYGEHRLDLGDELAELIAGVREYLKNVVSDN